MVPIFKGLAYAIAYRVFIGVNYFVIVMAWCVYYIAAGFTTELPWDTCLEEWNVRDCYSKDYDSKCSQDVEIFWNFECSDKAIYCRVGGN